MKIYLIDYNLDERENKKIYVSQYSSYKIGINVNGVDNSSIQLTKNNDETLIPSEGDFKGYNTYSFEAGTPETNTLNIWFPYKDGGLLFHLQVITTDSTVAELSSGGSTEIPTDLELSSLKVGNSDYPTINANEGNLYLKGQDLKVNAMDIDVIRTGDIYNMSTGGNYYGIAIQCDDLGVSQTINCPGGSLNSRDVNSTNVYAFENFYAPGLTSYVDQNDYLNNIAIAGKNITLEGNNGNARIEMGEYYDQNTDTMKNGFRISDITDMTFIDNNGMRFSVVPIEITDGTGMAYKVLTLQMA